MFCTTTKIIRGVNVARRRQQLSAAAMGNTLHGLQRYGRLLFTARFCFIFLRTSGVTARGRFVISRRRVRTLLVAGALFSRKALFAAAIASVLYKTVLFGAVPLNITILQRQSTLIFSASLFKQLALLFVALRHAMRRPAPAATFHRRVGRLSSRKRRRLFYKATAIRKFCKNYRSFRSTAAVQHKSSVTCVNAAAWLLANFTKQHLQGTPRPDVSLLQRRCALSLADLAFVSPEFVYYIYSFFFSRARFFIEVPTRIPSHLILEPVSSVDMLLLKSLLFNFKLRSMARR